jgi:osmoprotectant transport system ATP-binding protein
VTARHAAEIVFDSATKVYGAGAPAVDHLSLTVPAGEICVLVGPSGGGKTTALKLVNRLIELTSGTS